MRQAKLSTTLMKMAIGLKGTDCSPVRSRDGNRPVHIHSNGRTPSLLIDGGSVNIRAVAVSIMTVTVLGSDRVHGELQDVYVRQQNYGNSQRGHPSRPRREPHVSRCRLLRMRYSGKSIRVRTVVVIQPLEPFIMSVEGGAGGFFHNMVVTVDPY